MFVKLQVHRFFVPCMEFLPIEELIRNQQSTRRVTFLWGMSQRLVETGFGLVDKDTGILERCHM